MQCTACEAVKINGVICHEHLCPQRHIDLTTGEPYSVVCNWCGQDFTPEDNGQAFCSDDCAESFNG